MLVSAVLLSALAVCILLAVTRPGVAIGLLVCTYGFEQAVQMRTPVFVHRSSLMNIITAVVVVLALVSLFLRGRWRLSNVPANTYLLLALAMWAGVSRIWSPDPALSGEIWLAATPYLLVYALLAPLVFADLRDLKHALLTIMALGSLTALVTLPGDWVNRSLQFRAVFAGGPTGGNPLAIGSLGAAVALAALMLNFPAAAVPKQIARWALVGLGAALVIKSASRGQLVALLLPAVFFLPLSRRARNIAGFMATTTVLLLLAALTAWLFGQLITGQEHRWQWDVIVADVRGGRIETSLIVLKHWIKAGAGAWVFGLGSSASYTFLGIYPHFVSLEVLAELGFIGFGLFAAIMLRAALALKRLWPILASQPEARGILAALGALLLMEFLLSCKQGSMLGSPTLFAYAVLIDRLALIYVPRRAPTTAPAALPALHPQA